MKYLKFLIISLFLLNGNFVFAQSQDISDMQAHEIVLNGTPDDVKKLLETGYDVNKVYNCNTLLNTAIKSAARGKYALASPGDALKKVKILVNWGADINKIACPNNSMTALNWAISLPMHTYDLEQEIYSKLDILPQKSGECNIPTIISKSCKDISQEDLKKIKETIHSSFVINNKFLAPYFMEITKYLVENKADINRNNTNGMKIAPIHLAAMNSEEVTLEPLEYLIKEGGDVNITDLRGNTPLFYAFGNGNKKAVDILINAGADTEIKNAEDALYNEVKVQPITINFSENISN